MRMRGSLGEISGSSDQGGAERFCSFASMCRKAAEPDPANNRSAALVSVVIPAFNADQFVERAVRSALAQTCDDLEIIVVDDGSTDRTSEIVAAIAEKDCRVTLLRQTNQGVAAARNAGIACSQGQFVAPLDADDLWHSTKLEKQLEMFDRRPDVGLVYALYSFIDAEDKLIRPGNGSCFEGHVYADLIISNFIGNASSPLIRRSTLMHTMGFDPELRIKGAQGCEDLKLYLELAELAPFAVVRERLVGYRQHAGSMSMDLAQMERSFAFVLGEVRRKHPQLPGRLFRWQRGQMLLYLARSAVISGRPREGVLAMARAVHADAATVAIAGSWIANRLCRLLIGDLTYRGTSFADIPPDDTSERMLFGRPFEKRRRRVCAALSVSAQRARNRMGARLAGSARAEALSTPLRRVEAKDVARLDGFAETGKCDFVVEPRDGRPLVTVVIPCHNHGRYLGDAIESVLSQSWPTIEIIIVNDGSEDDTAAVIAAHPAIRAITQQRAGLSAARNAGFAASSGSYVAFLDADDLLLPNAIASGVRELDAHPECAFVSGGHRYVDDEGAPLGAAVLPAHEVGSYAELLRRNYIEMHATVLYRRQAFAAAGGFDTTLPACEDYDLYLRLARSATIRHHRSIVAHYRRHASNMSSNAELMLHTSLAVHRRQRPHLTHDPSLRVAYRDGIRQWRNFYGRQLFMQSLAKLRNRETRWQGATGLIVLAKRAPLRLVRSAGKSLLRATAAAGRALQVSAKRRLNLRGRYPYVGLVHFGSLRAVTPISPVFGFDRGTPVDRHYIEAFLFRHSNDVRGRVLEIGDDTYTRQFGGDRVTQRDVLTFKEGSPATFVGDLALGAGLPDAAFDCVILTQTLQLVFDIPAALATLARVLRPGGVLLLTVPGITRIDAGEWRDNWYWSFTPRAIERLCATALQAYSVVVESYGNVLAAIAFLHGLADDELRPAELAKCDPHFPVIVTLRAEKPA
ncbi:MAG: glycosyl transferase family 2 [Rhodospirillales bacterium]|nr:glycosyl transferase family 2 [Rhodospirillales bacterium]